MRTYDSVAEMVEKTTAAREQVADPYSEWQNTRFVGRTFHRWQDCVDAANSLWPQGVQIVEEMLAELRDARLPAPTSRKRRATWNQDNGDELCNDRLRSGQDYWRATTRQQTTAPQHVTIIAQIGALGEVDESDLIWRGAAAIALADLLEQAGYRVTIYGMGHSKMCSEYTTRCVTAKAAADPVNIASIINVMSGWFYRSIGLQEHTCGGYAEHDRGGTKPLYPSETDQIDENAIVIDDVYTRREAIALVRSAIETLEAKAA